MGEEFQITRSEKVIRSAFGVRHLATDRWILFKIGTDIRVGDILLCKGNRDRYEVEEVVPNTLAPHTKGVNGPVMRVYHRPYVPKQSSSPVGGGLNSPRLFLSHASADKDFVRRVHEALEKNGLHPWLDERELNAGDELRKTIQEVLHDSYALLIFLSTNTAGSMWVQYEAAFFAGAAKGRVIPIIVDDAGHNLVSRLPGTQGVLYLDFRDEINWDDNIKKLIEAAKKKKPA